MANEISVTLNATISQGGQGVSGTGSFNANLATTTFLGQEITIGSTTAAALYLAGISNPSVILIINQDSVNFIQVDSAATFDKFPQTLLPTQGVLLLPATGTIYAKADTAPCQVWVVAG